MSAGQYLGKRAVFIYIDDVGDSYLITLDGTLGNLAEVGLTQADVASGANVPQLPNNIKPRYVNWQGICDGEVVRKRLVCSNTSTAYASNTSVAFDIGGSTSGATTSRVGEKQTFLKLPLVGAGATP